MRVIAILIVFLSFSGQAKDLKIAANDSNITFIGRVDVQSKAVHFAHAGIQIKFKFKGTSLKFGLEDISDGTPEHQNFYNIYINGKKLDSIEINPAKRWYKIPYNFNNKVCEVELFKRTEAMVAGARFLGLKTNNGATISKVERLKRKIEWVGDSFTAGYGNLVSIAPPPSGNPGTGFHAKNQDNSLAWGALASNAVNAEYECNVFSGRGVYRNWDNSEEGTVPSFYNQISPNPNEGKVEWDFSKHQPDLVVINLGQNDFGPETHQTVVMTDSARFVNAYIDLLNNVQQKNPTAKILVIIGGGMSDYYPAKLKRLSRSRRFIYDAVNTFKAKNTTTIKTFELKTVTPPYGEDWHPTLAAHQIMAKQVTEEIQRYMNW